MMLYLHGFRSSPASFKAQMLAARLAALGLADQWHCPQLSASPARAVAQAMALATTVDPADLSVIGSSLGGFYARYVAEQLGCRVVFLNPAIDPQRDLARFFIEVDTYSATQYHSTEPFVFTRADWAGLAPLAVPTFSHSERAFLIAAKGDEVLDWREMVAAYPNARHKVLEGSDHGLSDFADSIDEVLQFCA